MIFSNLIHWQNPWGGRNRLVSSSGKTCPQIGYVCGNPRGNFTVSEFYSVSTDLAQPRYRVRKKQDISCCHLVWELLWGCTWPWTTHMCSMQCFQVQEKGRKGIILAGLCWDFPLFTVAFRVEVQFSGSLWIIFYFDSIYPRELFACLFSLFFFLVFLPNCLLGLFILILFLYAFCAFVLRAVLGYFLNRYLWQLCEHQERMNKSTGNQLNQTFECKCWFLST